MITVTGYTHIAMELWGMVFCLIAALCVSFKGKIEEKQNRVILEMMFCNAFMLFNDALSWVMRGNPSTIARFIIPKSNFFVFIANDVMMIIFAEYLFSYLNHGKKKKPLWLKCAWGIGGTAIITMVISQFNHMFYYIDADNFYHRNYAFPITQVYGIVAAVIFLVVIIRNKGKMETHTFISLTSYIILPLLALIIQLKVYGIALLNIAITISVLWIFIVLQIENAKQMVMQANQIVNQKKQMNDMQIQMVLSQIQPHFLYNCLNTIYYLCDKDTTVAQKAISDFSDYLRENLDSIKCKKPIPFETELNHVKKYLALEKLRFGDYLTICYDIETTNFMIPTLTIQPLVENAVKYGVGKAKNGGTVTIATRELQEEYEIVISDDGIGFDVNAPKDTSRSHIGLENVRERLWSVCKATMVLRSEIGKGTEIVIKIKK